MKKNIITILIIIILIIVGVVTYNYINSFHNVSFYFEQNNSKVEIYNNKYKIINSFKSNTFNLSLEKGEYYYKVIGDKYSSVTYPFKVIDKSEKINITPDYSDSYLALLLVNEKDDILNNLNNTYSKIIDNYKISNERLFKRGEWFGATIDKKTNNNFTDTYKVIFHKVNNKWEMVRYPEIVLTKYNYPDVPIEILNSLNDLSIN